jgi:hypothetical protein
MLKMARRANAAPTPPGMELGELGKANVKANI